MKNKKILSNCKGTVFDKRCMLCEIVNSIVVVALIITCNYFILDNIKMSILLRIIVNIILLLVFAFVEEKLISKLVNWIILKIIK